ncbi:MAG: hypothetical protein LKJ44_01450 [Bifidobacteriaceae bacterium]|jgi:hypothetical protein|nr:hypothetical protein [Bifidobacteriaceae bacterium]
MARELEFPPSHGSDSVSVEYSLENVGVKRIGAGPDGTGETGGFDDDIRIESIEEDEGNNVHDDSSFDYKVAAACGIFAGLCDSFFVGEFSLDRANDWGTRRVNEFVVWIAKQHPRFNGESLQDAIAFLEKEYKFVGDKATANFGGGLQHHLRDFSHHFSPAGLAFSILTQFTGMVYGTDQNGNFIAVPVDRKWFDEGLIGGDFCEKLFLGCVGWFFHMVSDMAGSSSNPGAGTGIPGPFLSLIKEISALAGFKNAMDEDLGIRKFVSKMFNGTLFARVNSEGRKEYRRFNLRTEIGVEYELGRQSLPVLLNECLTRCGYFLRHFYLEMQRKEVKSLSDLTKLEVSEFLPFNNPRVVRMVSIASATFVVVDLADATIRAALTSFKGNPGSGTVQLLLRINYVGVTRLVFAVGVDAKMVWERRNKRTNQQQEEDSTSRIAAGILSLKPEHLSVLFSVERLSVYEDIERGKSTDRDQKEQWLDQWADSLPEGCHFLNLDQTKQKIEELVARDGTAWKRLVLIELAQFRPYVQNKSDKKVKSLAFEAKTLDETWCKVCSDSDEFPVKHISKDLSRNAGILDGSHTRKIVGVAGTAAFMVASGGAAFVLAPAIAPILAGSAATGLYGAALTSASLAAVGGGALAAGGLGMAGGAAIIAGGGAVLGLASGSGATAITTLLTESKGEFALEECTKLLTFCKDSLAHGDMKEESIERIQYDLTNQIERMGIQQGLLSERSENKSLDKEKKKKAKRENSSHSRKVCGTCVIAKRNCQNWLVANIIQRKL